MLPTLKKKKKKVKIPSHMCYIMVRAVYMRIELAKPNPPKKEMSSSPYVGNVYVWHRERPKGLKIL